MEIKFPWPVKQTAEDTVIVEVEVDPELLRAVASATDNISKALNIENVAFLDALHDDILNAAVRNALLSRIKVK